MATQVKIALIGANGKMGTIAKSIIESISNYSLVACITRQDNLDSVLKSTRPDIAIELTNPESVFSNSATIIKNKVYPVIGTSGLTAADIVKLTDLCKENNMGGIIAPNFSLGMALINKLTKELKQYYYGFSIIEFHHAAKKDKPSGTARYTSQLLGIEEHNICSVRSDGFIAKQQLYVTGSGERIIIDHESFDRKSFAKGMEVCINKVMSFNHLVVGLENIL